MSTRDAPAGTRRASVCLTLALGLAATAPGADAAVTVGRVPDQGIQPRIAVDRSGRAHLVYFQGDPAAGDLFYAREREAGFAPAMRINSVTHSSIAVGTIRGAQFAIDPHGVVHVVWNGSSKVKAASASGPPMFYARSLAEGGGFEPQRVISGDWPVDGGGAVTADAAGRVFVFWHSAKPGDKEQDRRVYLSISADGGTTFAAGQPINPATTGVCACCAMQATTDADGNLYVVYRTAGADGQRDINLLVSSDHGQHFAARTVDTWRLTSCPMSSMSFGHTADKVLVAWETKEQVRFTAVAKGTTECEAIRSPTAGKQMKHPRFAVGPGGDILLAWTEGTGWNKGGAVAWQEFAADLTPLSSRQRLPAGVSAWSFVGAWFDRAGQEFSVMH